GYAVAAVVVGPLGIDSTDLARLELEEPDVVAHALHEPRRISAAVVMLHNVDRLVDHGTYVVWMVLKVRRRCGDSTSRRKRRAAVVALERQSHDRRRLESFASERLADHRVFARADLRYAFRPVFHLGIVGDIDIELDRVLECSHTRL